MNGLYALTIIMLIYALGDIIATKTKAVISMLFVGAIVFALGFWNGLPPTIFDDSALKMFSSVTIGLMLVHMGTTIKLRDLIEEYKTVIIVLCSTIGICAGVYLLGGMFIDKDYALIGAPILGGAVVAFLVMSEAMQDVGADVVAFGSLILVVQGIVGFPIASILCKKEANRLKGEINAGRLVLHKPAENIVGKSKWQIFPTIPEKYNGSNLLISKLAIVACLAKCLSDMTNGNVNMLAICLVLGVIFRELGFLEEAPLTKANGFTFVIGAATVNVFASLATSTPQMVLSMLKPLLIVIVIGVLSCAVVAIVVGKIFKQSWYMSVAMGATALFGFPGTFIVSNEVANAVGDTEEEKAIISQNITPKMIISGMVSVSIVSVIVAGIMAKWV